MDFGKYKYGGPFTTKQVEDVKSFLGILKVLIYIGPTFMVQTAAQSNLPAFAQHSNIFGETIVGSHNETANDYIFVGMDEVARHILFSNGLFSPLLVVMASLSTCCLSTHAFTTTFQEHSREWEWG